MNAADADLTFPVLGFVPCRRDGLSKPDLVAFPNLRRLTAMYGSWFKRADFTDTELIDVRGRRWIVRSASRFGVAEAFWLWLAKPLSWPLRPHIAFEVDELPPLSFAEIQERALATFAASWDEEDDDNPDFDKPGQVELQEILAQGRTLASVAEIIDLFHLCDWEVRFAGRV